MSLAPVKFKLAPESGNPEKPRECPGALPTTNYSDWGFLLLQSMKFKGKQASGNFFLLVPSRRLPNCKSWSDCCNPFESQSSIKSSRGSGRRSWSELVSQVASDLGCHFGNPTHRRAATGAAAGNFVDCSGSFFGFGDKLGVAPPGSSGG